MERRSPVGRIQRRASDGLTQVKLVLVAVGRSKGGPEAQVFDHFSSRLRMPLTVIEVEEKRPIKGSERKRREADLILQALPDGAYVAALDEKGKASTSREFATWFRSVQDQGASTLAYVIGGADGLHEDVKARADRLIAFGPMTWPHMLVRGMLAEQLYRAEQILAGHPYHKD